MSFDKSVCTEETDPMIPERLTETYRLKKCLESDKVIEGQERVIKKDDVIIDTFEYLLPRFGGSFKHKQTVLVDIPKIPSCYENGFYHQITDIRIENHEDDKIAEEVKRYLYFERPLPRDEYIFMVILLYTSYPLLRFKYHNLFDSFRRAAIVYHDRDVEKFRECVFCLVDFLEPDQRFVRQFSELTDGDVESRDEPVHILDILYTLRVWGTRFPFNAVVFSNSAISNSAMSSAEDILQKYDIAKYVRMSSSPPYYLVNYAETRGSKLIFGKSCSSKTDFSKLALSYYVLLNHQSAKYSVVFF